MLPKRFHKVAKISFILIALAFCYFRLKPIYFQTVAYTYDQGRDFIQAAEIVLYKNLTFIGPTTGIMGLYHGAWWYYLLTIPFLLFRGLPIGFYYFNFFLHFIGFVAVLYFLRKRFDDLTALIISLLIAVSPYFIYNAVFVGNNNITPLAMIAFLIINFIIIETQVKTERNQLLLQLLNGMAIGFISEFEFSFGLMIIPAYILIVIMYSPVRRQFGLTKLLAFIVGLGLAFTPRLLFELKHNFEQTRVLISFFFKPKLHNPKTYVDVFKDRIDLFYGYYHSLFPNDWTMYAFTVGLIILTFLTFKHKAQIHQKFLYFCLILIGLLFFFSTLYKDNFWANYYEGIHYVFLMIFGVLIAGHLKKANRLFGKTKLALLVVLILSLITVFIQNIIGVVAYDGLKVQKDIVKYVLTTEKNTDNYCVRVYTPPAIPHTYNYLFLYEHTYHGVASPQKEWQNNRCWFIIEHDDYTQRQQDWLKQNEPQKGKVLITKKIKDVTIKLWSSQ